MTAPSPVPPIAPRPDLSLKLRLGLGAALLGAGAILSAWLLYSGMADVARRLDTALASESRMSRYAALSTQVSTFLVISTEAVQSGLPPDQRINRLEPVASSINAAFEQMQSELQEAVQVAEALGVDQQSRFGTQSLGLARMKALLDNTMRGLKQEQTDKSRLRAYIDSFSTGFDPLLNQAVNTEVLFRNNIMASIEELRSRLVLTAIVIAGTSVVFVLLFYFGLVRPQFARLDRLRGAARQIGQADFSLTLPDTRQDEIGALYSETNRMAMSLAERQSDVQMEWSRLNETIDQRTQALRRANAQLEEIDSNRRRFFADVSHELRTPLTVILMEAQLGRQGAAEPTDAFTTIEGRAARLNRRIDDLLRVARSDSGKLALEPTATVLRTLAQDACEEVAAEISNAGMHLTCAEIPARLVMCDPNWVRQIVVGLVRNAIRHARIGGRVEIACSRDPDQGLIGLSVTDNGPGIASEDQTGIFERFAQSGAEKSEGFGIGLALAHWVIQEQGGRSDLTSPVPRSEALGDAPGTKISILLPMIAE